MECDEVFLFLYPINPNNPTNPNSDICTIIANLICTNPKYQYMTRAVRIFWKIFLYGFAAFVLLIILISLGVFGKMPSLAELENPSGLLKLRPRLSV